MTINFIGHGLTTNKNAETVGNYLYSSFRDENFNKFLGFSAYSTQSGIKKLASSLKVAKSNFEEIKFFIGIDDKITTKEVFQILLDLGVDCFTYHTQTDVIFHPKIYIFEGDRRNRIILGSSNLTKHGLFNLNIEASIVVDFSSGDVSGSKFLNQIKTYFKGIINVETENVKKIDATSLELFVQNGFIGSDKDKNKKIKKEEAPLLDTDNSFFPETSKIFISESDMGGITTNEQKNTYLSPVDKDKNYLSQHYLDTWNFNFEALTKFKEKHGHTVIPTDYEDEGLFEWTRRQKYLKNNGVLPTTHHQKLESIGFYWRTLGDWNSERTWDIRYAEFKEHYRLNNTFKVSRKENKELYQWLITQRMEYNAGLLLENQIEKMDNLDPKWKISLKEKNEDMWFSSLLQLENFKKEHGDCNVSQRENSLGRWLNGQRIDKKRGKLSSEKEHLLTSLGVIWDVKEHEFEMIFEKLIQYKKRFGNFDIELDYEDKQLANYVFSLKSRGTTPERRQRLDEVGFNWEKHYKKVAEVKSSFITAEWKLKVNKVKTLSSEGVDFNSAVPVLPQLKKIKHWVLTQQQRYRLGFLKDEQIKLLTDAGIKLEKVSKQDQRWANFYELLTLYKQEHGHCRVSESFDEELKNWVATQRGSYKDKVLDKTKIDKLNDLSFEWVVVKKRKNGIDSPSV